MVRQTLLLLAALLAFWPSAAGARVVLTAHVRYATQEGQSRYVQTDVTLMSGQELNTATTSFRFHPYAHYAVVFFSQSEAAVIELTGYFSCTEFTVSCVPSFGNM